MDEEKALASRQELFFCFFFLFLTNLDFRLVVKA